MTAAEIAQTIAILEDLYAREPMKITAIANRIIRALCVLRNEKADLESEWKYEL